MHAVVVVRGLGGTLVVGMEVIACAAHASIALVPRTLRASVDELRAILEKLSGHIDQLLKGVGHCEVCREGGKKGRGEELRGRYVDSRLDLRWHREELERSSSL